jgi:hypothetical protein
MEPDLKIAFFTVDLIPKLVAAIESALPGGVELINAG